jgi:flagellar hook-length control protein FliK
LPFALSQHPSSAVLSNRTIFPIVTESGKDAVTLKCHSDPTTAEAESVMDQIVPQASITKDVTLPPAAAARPGSAKWGAGEFAAQLRSGSLPLADMPDDDSAQAIRALDDFAARIHDTGNSIQRFLESKPYINGAAWAMTGPVVTPTTNVQAVLPEGSPEDMPAAKETIDPRTKKTVAGPGVTEGNGEQLPGVAAVVVHTGMAVGDTLLSTIRQGIGIPDNPISVDAANADSAVIPGRQGLPLATAQAGPSVHVGTFGHNRQDKMFGIGAPYSGFGRASPTQETEGAAVKSDGLARAVEIPGPAARSPEPDQANAFAATDTGHTQGKEIASQPESGPDETALTTSMDQAKRKVFGSATPSQVPAALQDAAAKIAPGNELTKAFGGSEGPGATPSQIKNDQVPPTLLAQDGIVAPAIPDTRIQDLQRLKSPQSTGAEVQGYGATSDSGRRDTVESATVQTGGSAIAHAPPSRIPADVTVEDASDPQRAANATEPGIGDAGRGQTPWDTVHPALHRAGHGTAAPAMPPDLPATASRVIVETAVQNANSLVELTLTPEELGRVKMTLSAQDGALSLSISAERPETLDLLRRNADSLLRDFRDLGYSSVDFQFQQNGRGRSSPAPETTEAADTPRPIAAALDSRGIMPAVAPEPTAHHDGLDIRI